ncbi:sensor histidine kinase [Pedobacter terrae]|uniref:sensor histidine kinase n=1 Tax=Pedobacter terrae TaxID=405671 RepID=UPI002FF9DD4A
MSSIWQRVVFITLFVLALAGLALLKDFRIHNFNSFDQTFEYITNFLGKTLLFYLFLYGVNKLDVINQYKKLEHELNNAKEQLLRNQMHPHFLFNAFNSLYSLCLKNSAEAAEYVLKLSSMMRYLTDETHLSKVPLTRELDFIKGYIDIEKMRFGKDVSIQLVTNGNINGDKLIPPFLLVALVENAFKHGFYTNAKNAYVTIKLELEKNELLFCVENSVFAKQHFQESSRKGKGLSNLRQRLELLYPKNFSFEINNADNRYNAQLKITLN